MPVKETLKIVIMKNLENCASTFFVDKTLAIIDESAETKESFLAASDRICKRIALFIDSDLAAELSAVLNVEIESITAQPGIRRRHVRVEFRTKVFLIYNGFHYEFYAENLSEGGMYVKADDPFPVGSELIIRLPLGTGAELSLSGRIMNIKNIRDKSKNPPGMGIEFHKLNDEELNQLKTLIRKATHPELSVYRN
jgi:type IV pilus assembly protein PilZ